MCNTGYQKAMLQRLLVVGRLKIRDTRCGISMDSRTVSAFGRIGGMPMDCRREEEKKRSWIIQEQVFHMFSRLSL